LKSVKPGLLLLSEDKGALSQAYQLGFDAAYDWTTDTTWVSQWSWQTHYNEKNSLTIFNDSNVSKRRDLLRKALFNNGDSKHLRLRFLENNDMPRFIKSHDLQQTKNDDLSYIKVGIASGLEYKVAEVAKRMMKIFRLGFLSIVFNSNTSMASSIIWKRESATVWFPAQTISGEVKDFSAAFIIVHHDDTAFTVPINNNGFTFNCNLHNAANHIWAEIKNKNTTIYSDTLMLTLGYKLLPVIKPFATVKGNQVLLHALLLDNPLHKPLAYLWKADERNPSPVIIHKSNDSIASVMLPAVTGDYLFSVIITAGFDTATFVTYVTRNNKGIIAFNIDTSHAEWIDKAIVYEIAPHHFVDSTKYADIAAKLPELKSLGINTIWLQPLYKTKHGGQGYDVTDYFSLRPEFGSEEELQQLITAAKNLKMHVLFDFVPNHTSIDHLYAKK
jgi:hypothetical protein